MAVRVKCPNPACGKEFTLKPELAGKTVKCPACQQAFVVPAAVVAQPPPAVPAAQSPPEPPDPLIGAKIAHYQIQSLLGQGGMGKVYKARNINLNKTCALKILPPEFSRQDATLTDRFIREARSAAAVEHPNVLPVQFVGKVGENYFIEMQYVDGGTLHDLLSQQGQLNVMDAARIVRDVASALEAAHEKGIIHRDIKPSNVMLTKKGQVFVADFGLAKVGQGATALTQSGWIMGTPLYMSPEQCQGKALDHRSDIYSLGAMFYEMLAGRPPYHAEDFAGLVAQHLTAPVPDIRAAVPGVPDFIAAIIMRMMAKRPEERYQNCGEIVQELNQFLTAPATAAGPAIVISESAVQKAHEARRAAVFGKKKRSPVPLVLGLVLVLVLGGVAYWIFTAETQRTQRLEVGGQRSGKATTTTAETAKPPSAPSAPTQDLAKTEGEKRKAEEEKKESVPSADKVSVAPKPKPSAESPKFGEKPLPSAVAVPLKPEPRTLTPPVDLVSYYDEVKAVNELIDKYDYESASARANLLKEKYRELIQMKLSNLERIVALRKRCIERVNSGAARVSMADVSKRYAFAGDVKSVDEQTITATIKKKWSDLSKEEIANFYRKSADSNNPEDLVGIAAFLTEGSAAAEDLDSGLNMLGKAKGLGGDVSAFLKYLDTLKQAAKGYAEAEAKGKALETTETAKAPSTPRTETQGGEKTKEKPLAPLANLAVKSFDDVYVTTAATGEKIPHPLSRKTNTIIVGNQRIKVPEGMVFVPAGPFIMGDDKDKAASPAHEVDVNAFFIDKYEVTNAQYLVFVKATGHQLPDYIEKNGGNIPQGRENHPVAMVSWQDAKAYCDWCGKRLPSEAEWEKAASWDAKKKSKRKYPWGDSEESDSVQPLANWAARWGFKGETGSATGWKRFSDWRNSLPESNTGKREIGLGGGTTPVGKFRAGISPHRCYDMAGNVWEWVEDWLDKYPGNTNMPGFLLKDCGQKAHVFRGGCWQSPSFMLTTCERLPGLTGPDYWPGFRCAADCPWEPAEPAKTSSAPSSGTQQAVVAQPPSAVQSYDDVYVTTAATGDKIPHPLSRKTQKLNYQGKSVDVPEGMVYVPASLFTMGTGRTEHKVYLDAYFIGKYEVTNAEWKAFTDATNFTPLPKHWKAAAIPEGKQNHPVIYLWWDNIQKYCEWVSKETGQEVKLPTEAQWEKAARGPKAYTYPWGDDWNPRNCNWNGTWVAKYGMNPDPNKGVASDVWRAFMKSEKFNKEVVEKLGGLTAPVGSFPRGKSFYGCYDMAGNAYECCADWFKADYYKLKDAMRNPQGPNEEDADADTNVKDRVVRGGSWCNDPGDCRSFHRDRPHSSLTRPYTLGFRVVISASAQRSASAIPAPAQQTPASPPTQNVAQPPSTVKSYDDVYVTTAATGDKIPHPLSKKTYNLYYMGRAVKVPEGMVFVPAGEFIMGEGKEPPNGPEHKVWVDAYCIGKYEVTNAEWKLFMEANGENRPRYLMEGIPKGRENHPATYIGRHEAMRYSEWVSKETGSDVRLPTEAQWEKAARGKKAFIYPWGNDWDERFFSGSLSLAKAFGLASTYGPEFAKLMKEWPNTEKGKELLALGGVTCPVGSFPRDKSPYGCYDMAGNDLEWCSDWYKADYYVKSPKSNPQGPKEDEADMATIAGEKRRALVYRGGAWLLGNPKTWARGFTPTGNAVFSHGLRIVCLPEKK